MSLPSKAIDRLFDRLAATYGRYWFALWEGVDASAVKTLWAHELAVFEGRMESIAWALENLPTRCPNAIEFKALCRQAPMPEAKILPLPKADPQRVKAELAKLAPARAAAASGALMSNHKAWANRLKRRHEAGDRLNPNQIRCYQQALRIAPATFDELEAT